VGTIGGLILNRRIPPGSKCITMSAPVRFKPVPPAFKEMRNSFPVPGWRPWPFPHGLGLWLSHPNKILNTFLVKELLYNFQHACKLREQQNPVATVKGICHYFFQCLYFAAFTAVIFNKEDGWQHIWRSLVRRDSIFIWLFSNPFVWSSMATSAFAFLR